MERGIYAIVLSMADDPDKQVGGALAQGGALIAIVLMLYRAITDLIGVIHPDEVSDLVEDQEV